MTFSSPAEKRGSMTSKASSRPGRSLVPWMARVGTGVGVVVMRSCRALSAQFRHVEASPLR
jgi:hypothetical protein